ncbi:hypothetical protein [Kluyvera cryocrescens]|uniref:hypothetical protein n=1 Tax=Kluyvera cryocrescens TaxID=580 RepID=UPI000D8758D8|nr:hypothetical protein [Kluyvera cryocrescens]SQC34247.1 Uncharacterised protein [Kluyvera cryocrescens]
MTINLTDPANHPANGRLTDERIDRVIEALRRSLEYQNGGDMAYVIADAIKGLEELLVSREVVPVMYCSQETIAASKDGEHLLRTLSTPSGDCVIPLYTAASVIADSWIPVRERMPDPKSELRVCAYTPTQHENLRYRFVAASLFKSVCRDATHWHYMGAPQEVKS